MADAQFPASLPGGLADLFGGGQNVTTTTTNLPPKYLQGPMGDAAKYAGNILFPGGNLAPYPYPDQHTAVFDPLSYFGQVLSGQQALQNVPLSSTANALGEATLGGSFMYPQTNPWLDATYNKAAQGVSDVYRYATAPSTQAEFARAGSFGGSANNQSRALQQFGLGNTLNDLATNIYGQNYEQERARQQAQQYILPTLQQFGATIPKTIEDIGTQRQGLQQSLYNTQYQNQFQRAQYPYQSLQMYTDALAKLAGGAGSFGSTTGPNPNYNPLGALMGLEQLGQSNTGGGSNTGATLGALGGALAPALISMLGSALGG